MYTLIPYNEQEKWQEQLAHMQHKDIYFSPEYCDLYREIGDGEPYLFVYKAKNGNKILYPFLKRSVTNLSFARENFREPLFDITTPYGYGGPIYSSGTSVDDELVRDFRNSFEDFCLSENIITEFVRFHPLLGNQYPLKDHLHVQYSRDTVYIDLTKPEEDLYQNFHIHHLRNIKKAIKSGLTFEILDAKCSMERIHEFHNLYEGTMDKRKASRYYYFPVSYFQKLIQNLADHVVMVVVSYNDRMIAAALLMSQGNYLHYHLGCSDRDYLNLSPNHFLFYQAALWGKKHECTMFHLGGGYQNRDSLFQFKSRFHPQGTLPFYVGKKIHNQPLYKELVRLWKEHHSERDTDIDIDYFPAYRQ